MLQHVETFEKILLRQQVKFLPTNSKQLGKVVEVTVIKGR